MIFLDASALVKAYVNEDGSQIVEGMLVRFKGEIFLTGLVALEVLATLGKRLRTRKLARRDYASARALFLHQLQSIMNIVEVSEAMVRSAWTLADTHRTLATGAMDLLHVASAIDVEKRPLHSGLVVASSDHALLDLARANHLSTFNPEREPLGALLARVRR